MAEGEPEIVTSSRFALVRYKRSISSIIHICGIYPTDETIDMSLLAILLFVGTMSLWATMRVRQVYNKFSLPIQTLEEETAVAKVLQAAAWTYVAAFITSLVYFLLHVLPLLGVRRE